ncbi:hypothetical protein ACC713_38125, partial [Rhizobium johnstonii]
FVRLSAAFSTGSSLLPQKKNPDASELVRAQTFLAEIGVDVLQLYRDNTISVFDSLKKEGLAMGLPVTLLIAERGCLI